MEIQYNEFLSNIAQTELLSRHIKKSTEKEYTSMIENHRLMSEICEQQSSSIHNMFFRSLTNGELVFYDQMILDFDRNAKDLINRRNKNYLWLLVDAFEYFENFLNLIYAHIGHKDPSAWPARETKGETTIALAAKPFEWFLQKSASNKKLSVKLDCIRQRFPTLVVAERSNYFGIDFRFTICLIEMLRHIIVHKNGVVTDFQKFVSNTFVRAGMALNLDSDQQKIQQINDFVVQDGNAHRISLLEIHQLGTPFYLSRISAIIGWILSYANHIYCTLIRPTYFQTTE